MKGNLKSKDYREEYIQDVKNCLIVIYNASPMMAEFMITKFKQMLYTDPEYVFHYDSEYWAKYIAETAGLICEEVYA